MSSMAKETKELTELVTQKDHALAIFEAKRAEYQRQRSRDLGQLVGSLVNVLL